MTVKKMICFPNFCWSEANAEMAKEQPEAWLFMTKLCTSYVTMAGPSATAPPFTPNPI